MGREIKRVAAGFDWPIDKVWDGFINPHFKPCPEDQVTCFGGATAAAKWLDAISRFIALICEECAGAPYAEQWKARGRIYPHPYLDEFPQAPRYDIPLCVREESQGIKDNNLRMQFIFRHLHQNPPKILPLTDELLSLLKKFAKTGDFGVGGGAAWKIQEAVFSVAGVDPEQFGRCPVCKGEGIDPAAAAVYEAWTTTEPPEGDWYQVWETVSEGSPVTPAFATAGELVDYLVTHGDAWDHKRGRGGWKREAAESFVGVGWAPSLMTLSDGKTTRCAEPRDGALV